MTYGFEIDPAGGWLCGHCGQTGFAINMEGDDMAMSIPWDVVALRVTAEKEVQTETVRVMVSGNLVAAGDDTGKTKAMLSAALAKVHDGQWSLTTARRGEDPSGMERVSVAASIRVKEHLTAGLVERLKQASRAGLQLHLDRILTRPPKAEMDKVLEELRQQLYQRAREEAELLNRLLPAEEGKWRVGSIEFAEVSEESDRAGRAPKHYASASFSARADLDDSDPDPDLPVSTRTVLEAKVQLKRLSIAAPEGGFCGEG